MVQQPFGGFAGQQQVSLVAGQPQAQQSTSLAMPAIISNNGNMNGQQQASNGSQYSPQASYYQQQLIKSAQQQFAAAQQQQQQQQQTRQQLSNGLNGTSSQQDSPIGASLHHLQQQESHYNGLQANRLAPIYAPRPTYYSASNAINGQPAQQLYQSARIPQQQANYYQQQQQQQQHSPATLMQQQQQPLVLGVRQNGQAAGGGQLASNLSSSGLSPQMQQQQQHQQQQQNSQQLQQMQQLVMSYQQQQQQQQPYLPTSIQPQDQLLMSSQLENSNLWHQQQQQQLSDKDQANLFHQSQQQQQRQPIQQQHHLLSAPTNRSAQRGSSQPQVATRPTSRFSDRDSVSTVSRFNQLDDRRSFTMRSQYTSSASKSAQKFSFLQVTSEAVKLILGLDNQNSGQRQPLLVADSKPDVHLSRSSSASKPDHLGKVTVIDSGEDYYFKRKVFSYQLVILRLINLLCSLFVLLSPVVMLLMPKMEPLLRQTQLEQTASSSTEPAGSSLLSNSPVTHAVGLPTKQHLLLKQQQQQHSLQQQQQWKISECSSSECDGPLIGFVVRLIMLSVAHWAIFFRQQTVTLPRVDFHRCLLISLATLIVSSYWLFFIFRVFDKPYNDFELHYMTIIQFAVSMLEALILLHYLALVLLELRQRRKTYCLKVVRSPDGQSRYYSCGALSIQKCAQFVLEKYHRDFRHYDAYNEQLMAYEDELAMQLRQHGQSGESSSRGQPTETGGHQQRSSRAASPAADRRSRSTASRRHKSSERSPSPARSSRSRSNRKSTDDKNESSKLFQVDSEPPSSSSQQPTAAGRSTSNEEKSSRRQESNKKRDESRENDDHHHHDDNSSQDEDDKKAEQSRTSNATNGENSADQSSDATSRMKESSLETIRAASEAKVDIVETSAPPASSGKQRRDNELESVRSGRSRRSTASRHHNGRRRHHHHHHRERSSSRLRTNDEQDEEEEEQVVVNNVEHHHQHHHSHRQRPVGQPIEDPLDEHERKLRRRKLRLLAEVEDAFGQVREFDEGAQLISEASQQAPLDGSGQLPLPTPKPGGLDANQLARTMYPKIARSLQKYLRLTKQTGRHNLQSIYEHLSKCILYKLNARTFLEKFTQLDPVWQQSETDLFADCRLSSGQQQFGLSGPGRSNGQQLEINSWSLVCDTLLSRQVDSGTFFLLKQGRVSLLVSVARLPHLSLTEQVVDHGSCKFSFGQRAETSSV